MTELLELDPKPFIGIDKTTLDRVLDLDGAFRVDLGGYMSSEDIEENTEYIYRLKLVSRINGVCQLFGIDLQNWPDRVISFGSSIYSRMDGYNLSTALIDQSRGYTIGSAASSLTWRRLPIESEESGTSEVDWRLRGDNYELALKVLGSFNTNRYFKDPSSGLHVPGEALLDQGFDTYELDDFDTSTIIDTRYEVKIEILPVSIQDKGFPINPDPSTFQFS